jgi:hypothetical protein
MVVKNHENPFVLDWIEAFGYPIWRESYLTQEQGNTGTMVVVTPLAKINDNHTSGFLLAFPHYWTTPQFYVDITDRESIDAHVLAELPDTMGYAYKVAVSLDFDNYLFSYAEQTWGNWLNDLLNNLAGGLKSDIAIERTSIKQVFRCIPYYVLTKEEVVERDPCPDGQYLASYSMLVPCEPSVWSNIYPNNPNNNTGGSGGSVFSNDFTSDIFTSNNFYYQMSECPFSNEDPPLIYATSGSSANWAGQFMNAVNYYLEQTLNSGSTTFNEALGINYSTAPNSQFNHIPYGNSHPKTMEALSEVFEKMKMKYNACNNQYLMGGEGGAQFNPALCTCLGNYSVEDGLDDFFMNLYGLNTEDFVELFGVVMELKGELGLTQAEVDWLLSHSDIALTLNELMGVVQTTYGNDANDAVLYGAEIYDAIEQVGLLYGPYDDDFIEIIEEQMGLTGGGISFFIAWTYECAFLKLEYPNWTLKQIALFALIKVTHETVHGTLDGAGMIPGFGEIADLTNATLYTIEGDGINATLSVASAIPIGGWFTTTAKYCSKIVVVGAKRFRLVSHRVGSTVGFASNNALRAQLRGLLQTNTAVDRAHHIIPLEHVNSNMHPVIEQAAKGYGLNTWHPNMLNNGINVTIPRHTGSHGLYNQKVLARLNAISNQYGPNISSQDAISELNILMSDIKQAIINQPNTTINLLNF